jgi:hypothetical protein
MAEKGKRQSARPYLFVFSKRRIKSAFSLASRRANRFGFIVGAPSGAMLLDVIGEPAFLEHAASQRGIPAEFSLASRRISSVSL